ncbi:MAG: hypothetical protein WDN44_14060 [Sphingomonas sp.]
MLKGNGPALSCGIERLNLGFTADIPISLAPSLSKGASPQAFDRC